MSRNPGRKTIDAGEGRPPSPKTLKATVKRPDTRKRPGKSAQKTRCRVRVHEGFTSNQAEFLSAHLDDAPGMVYVRTTEYVENGKSLVAVRDFYAMLSGFEHLCRMQYTLRRKTTYVSGLRRDRTDKSVYRLSIRSPNPVVAIRRVAYTIIPSNLRSLRRKRPSDATRGVGWCPNTFRVVPTRPTPISVRPPSPLPTGWEQAHRWAHRWVGATARTIARRPCVAHTHHAMAHARMRSCTRPTAFITRRRAQQDSPPLHSLDKYISNVQREVHM